MKTLFLFLIVVLVRLLRVLIFFDWEKRRAKGSKNVQSKRDVLHDFKLRLMGQTSLIFIAL